LHYREYYDLPVFLKKMKAENSGKAAWPIRVWRFYVEGFKSMTIGKSLWVIILLKLAILFLVFRLFFFPDVLGSTYNSDEERAQAVRSALTERTAE